jgi:hypothetical protein
MEEIKMTRPIVRIYTAPGEFIDREMNDDEFAQYQIDQAEEEARQAEAEAKAAAKAAAQAKLSALGLTVEDLKALGL